MQVWRASSSGICGESVQRVRVGLACLVTLVWLVGYGIAYARGAQTPTELSGLMAVVLGWAFAAEVKDAISKRTKRSDERDS